MKHESIFSFLVVQKCVEWNSRANTT